MIYNNITPIANNYSLENQMLTQSQNGDFYKDPPKVVKKKVVFFVLLTVLAISTIGLSLLANNSLDIRGRAANTGSQISMLPASKSVILGEEFIVSVSLNTGPDKVSAVDLKISYDPTALLLSDFVIKDPLPHTLSPFKDNPQTGLVSVVLAADPTMPFFGNGIIGTFKVKVINPKKTGILFTANTKASAIGKQADSLIQKTGITITSSIPLATGTDPLTSGTETSVVKETRSVIKSTVNKIKSVTLSNTAPSVITTTFPEGSKGLVYSTNLVISKPDKNSKPSIDVSGLPFGLYKTSCTDSTDNLSILCTISGTPAQSGLYGILVRVVESNQPVIEKTLPLQIK